MLYKVSALYTYVTLTENVVSEKYRLIILNYNETYVLLNLINNYSYLSLS